MSNGVERADICGLSVSFISSFIPLTTINRGLICFWTIQVHCLIFFKSFYCFLNSLGKELKGREGCKHCPLLPGMGKGWWGRRLLMLTVSKVKLGPFVQYQKPEGSLGILAAIPVSLVALAQLPNPSEHLQL